LFKSLPSTVVHACNPGTLEAEAGGLRVHSQPELHSKTLFEGRGGEGEGKGGEGRGEKGKGREERRGEEREKHIKRCLL
jgi:hypothetical protein